MTSFDEPARDHGHATSFDERAPDWDTPERRERAEQVAAAVRASVPLRADTRLIDIGAGTGLLGLALLGDVGELVLAEPSGGMLAVARDKIAAVGDGRVSAVRFDLTADPPPGEPFDLAVSMLVLHHVENTPAAMAAIFGLLRPGGWIALADLDTEDGSFHEADTEGIHHHGFDRDALAGLARAAGFVDVGFRTATQVEHESRRFPVFLLVARRP
ncbi:MAG: class I SAM-dependent methyltransferase [Chloroflexi bacterium]|nr:class I SAM-dependent methyltransferase [Chloroflexota bacterium]